MATIEHEQIASWDIPEYYDRTSQFIVVTSPLYNNSGHYSDEAVALFEPLEKALKSYFRQQSKISLIFETDTVFFDTPWYNIANLKRI
jgi:hypothetical protein